MRECCGKTLLKLTKRKIHEETSQVIISTVILSFYSHSDSAEPFSFKQRTGCTVSHNSQTSGNTDYILRYDRLISTQSNGI